MSQQVTLTLEYLRTAAGLTQAELGRLLGLNRVTVLRWETGQTKPSSGYVRALARALKVPTAVVLDALNGQAA